MAATALTVSGGSAEGAGVAEVPSLAFVHEHLGNPLIHMCVRVNSSFKDIAKPSPSDTVSYKEGSYLQYANGVGRYRVGYRWAVMPEGPRPPTVKVFQLNPMILPMGMKYLGQVYYYESPTPLYSGDEHPATVATASDNGTNSDTEYTKANYTPYDSTAPKRPTASSQIRLIAVPNNAVGFSFLHPSLHPSLVDMVDSIEYAKLTRAALARATKLDGGCQGVGRPFVKHSIDTCDFFLYYVSIRGEVVYGFATVRAMDEEDWEIHLMCANKRYSGIGTKLIDAVIRIARHNKILRVVVRSVPTATEFYTKRGFQSYGPNEKGLIVMGTSVTRRRRKTRRR